MHKMRSKIIKCLKYVLNEHKNKNNTKVKRSLNFSFLIQQVSMIFLESILKDLQCELKIQGELWGRGNKAENNNIDKRKILTSTKISRR